MRRVDDERLLASRGAAAEQAPIRAFRTRGLGDARRSGKPSRPTRQTSDRRERGKTDILDGPRER